jgi:Amt family ammonium transporter
VNGLVYGGGFALLGKQAVGGLVVLAYSFLATLALGWALQRRMGLRIPRDAELEGIDLTEHAESAYELEGLGGGGGGFGSGGSGVGGALGGLSLHTRTWSRTDEEDQG